MPPKRERPTSLVKRVPLARQSGKVVRTRTTPSPGANLGLVGATKLRLLLENVRKALGPKKLFLVKSKPYFLFHDKRDLGYLQNAGFTKDAAYHLLRWIEDLKVFHMDVMFSQEQEQWKQPLTARDLVVYFSPNNVDADLRRTQVTKLLLGLTKFLVTHRKNELPVTDKSHATFARGLARWYLHHMNLPIPEVPETGHLLDFFDVTGKPSVVLIVKKTMENPKPNSNCNVFRRNFKVAEEAAERMIVQSLDANALQEYQKTYKSRFSSLLGTMRVESLYPKSEQKRQQTLDTMKEAVFQRYSYIKEKCYVIEPGSVDENYRKRGVLLQNIHDVAIMLCDVLKQMKF